MDSIKKIVVVTHDGVHHADEVFASILLGFLAMARGLAFEVIRTRNPQVIEEWRLKGAFVLDVGGKYDGIKSFDHHQRDFSKVRESGKAFATAGLIWEAFGLEVLCFLTKSNNALLLKKVCAMLDDQFFSAVDGRDVGRTTHNSVDGYIVQTVSDIIRECQSFDEAMEIGKVVLANKVRTIFEQVSNEELVRDALAPQLNLEVVVFHFDKFVDWKGIVVAESPETLLCVFWDGKEWKISSVPVKAGSFESRLLLPSPWRGLSGAELQAVSGFKSASFCHQAGFIAGFGSLDEAKEAAHFTISRLDPDQVV